MHEVPNDDDSVAAAEPRFYAFNKVSKQPLPNGQALRARAAALEALDRARTARSARSSRCPTGILVVRDEKGAAAPTARSRRTPTAGG